MRTSPLRLLDVDHTVLPANTPHLPLPEDERLSWPCWLRVYGKGESRGNWLSHAHLQGRLLNECMCVCVCTRYNLSVKIAVKH